MKKSSMKLRFCLFQMIALLTVVIVSFSVSALQCQTNAKAEPMPMSALYCDYKLYCNDEQIDLSNEPLFLINDPKTGENTLYFSCQLYGMFERLGLYSGGKGSSQLYVYTKGYIQNLDNWINYDNFYPRYQLALKIDQYNRTNQNHPIPAYGLVSRDFIYKSDGRYFTDGNENPRFGNPEQRAIAVALGDSIYFKYTPSYWINYWFDLDKILDLKVDKPELPPPLTSAQTPTMYPNENKAFAPEQTILNAPAAYSRDTAYHYLYNDIPINEINSVVPLIKVDSASIGRSKNYIPIKTTMPFLDSAVIVHNNEKTVFVYSKDYLESSKQWVNFNIFRDFWAKYRSLHQGTLTLNEEADIERLENFAKTRFSFDTNKKQVKYMLDNGTIEYLETASMYNPAYVYVRTKDVLDLFAKKFNLKIEADKMLSALKS